LSVIDLYDGLPRQRVAFVLGRQFLDSGTSPGAHFREALRARSKAEYVAKLNGGLLNSKNRFTGSIFVSLIRKWKP